MSTSPLSIEEQKKAFYESEMQRYRNMSDKVAELRGRGITHLSTDASRNKEWWNCCRFSAVITTLAITILAGLIFAALVGTGVIILT